MKYSKSKHLTTRFLVSGFLLGLVVPVAVSIIHLSFIKLPVTVSNILNLAFSNTLYTILFLLPILFAVIVWLVGLRLIRQTTRLNQTISREYNRAQKIYEFAEKLKNGEIDVQYEVKDKDDVLGEVLIELRDNLQKTQEEEKIRRYEDHQRNWVTEGLAKFADILRNNDNLEDLATSVIQNLVNYLEANQGGFFILYEDEETGKRYFELTAHLAYDRKKYNPRRFEWGEGLIGRCGLEMLPIFMTDLPSDYINVTSGLGDANPRCLLLVPLIANEEIHGVIEVASFKKFEKFQVSFVEKLAESIASTIANVKINLRTNRLLKESQIQAEKLAKQEVAMRKNMEKLRKTQEEAAKQAEEFISFTNSVNHTLIRAEYNVEGKLLYANTKFLNKLGYSSNQEVEGRHISMFINKKDIEWFNKIWGGLAKGGKHYENYMKHVTKEGRDLWTMATYTCVRNLKGEVEKILFLAIDTTEEKKRSLDYVGQIDALNRSSIKAEFLPDGRVLETNEKFSEATEYTKVELRDKSIFHFISKNQLREFKNAWREVINKKSFEGQIKLYTQLGDEIWFQATFSAVNDMYGDVAKVILIANDITEQKDMEFENQRQTEKLKLQEEKLRQSQIELSKKLEETRREIKAQFQEIEHVKIRHEKTLEGALDAIVTINQLGVIKFFNQAAENLWGIKKTEVMGKSVRMLLPPEHQDKDDTFIHNYLENEVEAWLGTRTEINITNKEGEEVPVLITLAIAKVGNEFTYTAFIQNVSIELF